MGLIWTPGPFTQKIQLDIAGFLAILGEGAVESNLQVSTLSKLVFTPRLVPAPQVFLRPTRKSHLETTEGNVTGIFSGNDKDHINYIGHVVLDAEGMPDYSVRCVEILKKDGNKRVKSKTKGPLSLLILLGFCQSIAILVVSIHNRDGFAILAVVLFSFLSTLAGMSNWWQLALPKRRLLKVKSKDNKRKEVPKQPPKGDVVIRYPNGSFLVVECEENVARELYFAPENIFYLIESPWMYRLISLGGTLMLMVAIVALGNAEIVQQLLFAGAYMLLNVGYWTVAALPSATHWDLSAFEVRKQRFDKSGVERDYKDDDDGEDLELDYPEGASAREKRKMQKMKAEADATFTDLNPTFTHAIWKAIIATKSITWVRKNDALPETPVWDQWLKDALVEARKSEVTYATDQPGCKYNVKSFSVPEWDPLKHFYKLLEIHKRANTFSEKEPEKEEVSSVESPQAASGAEKGTCAEETHETPAQAENLPEQEFIPVSPRRQGTGLE